MGTHAATWESAEFRRKRIIPANLIRRSQWIFRRCGGADNPVRSARFAAGAYTPLAYAEQQLHTLRALLKQEFG